jgi:hypothetical protein
VVDEVVDEEKPFFVHLRCACHTLQLCIGDLAEHMPLAVSVLSKIANMPRSKRIAVEIRRQHKNCSRTKLVQPTSTRWNGSTRAAATAIEFWRDLRRRLEVLKR